MAKLEVTATRVIRWQLDSSDIKPCCAEMATLISDCLISVSPVGILTAEQLVDVRVKAVGVFKEINFCPACGAKVEVNSVDGVIEC